MKFRATALVGLLVAGLAMPGTAAAVPAAPDPSDCSIDPGVSQPPFWPRTRLKLDRVRQITRGKGVLVAVVDSGLNTEQHPQLRGITLRRGADVIPFPGFKNDTRDCYGHGTAVTSIIAAQPVAGHDFEGIAPGVTIMPIKQTQKQGDASGSSETVGAGIEAAIRANARVVNVSITTPTPTPQLENAVRLAARRNIVIVAAAGNDGAQGATKNRPAYPAAYANDYPNVIAVSSTTSEDGISEFSTQGKYVSVAAPGDSVPAASAIDAKYVGPSGTSFAAPYVAGTAALLRARFPDMTAAQVRNRIEATADRPPASVPDRRYGWGIVNPFLALTTVRNDDPPPSSSPVRQTAPARAIPKPPDRSLQNTALASAAVLLGLVMVVIAAAVVLRARGRRESLG